MPSKVSEHILYLSVDAFFDTIRVDEEIRSSL